MCYALSMANHKVKWEEHSGLKGGKTFPPGTSRAKVEGFHKSKARDPKVKRAWIEWGSIPKMKGK
jgi:hypothetical protein